MNPYRLFKALAHRLGTRYIQELCRREYESQTFNRMNERPIELSFVFRQLLSTGPKKILDVGTGLTALPSMMRNCGFMVTATDNIIDYWPSGMVNRHYLVKHDDITCSQLKESFDVITCISVLEHIEAYDDAMKNMFRLLKPGGHLIMTFPYNETKYIHNVYQLPGASYGQDVPYICQMFSRRELERWLAINDWQIREQEFWQFWEGEFWTFGNPNLPPRQVNREERHQLTCLLLKKGGEVVL